MKSINIIVIFLFAFMPRVFADNPIRNSSFELGREDYGIQRYIRTGEKIELKFIEPVSDMDDKVHGQQSLSLSNPNADAIELISREYHLDPNKVYTFSFYMKASKVIDVRAGQYAGKYKNIKERDWTLHTSRIFKITTEWQRFSMPFAVKDNRGWYFTKFRWGNNQGISNDATVSIDALQIDEGDKTTDYKPLAPVESALSGDERVRVRGQSISCILKVVNYSQKVRRLRAELQINDSLFPDKTFLIRKINQKIAAGEKVDIPVNIDTGRYGHFSVGGSCVVEDITYPLGLWHFAEIPESDLNIYNLKRDFVVGINSSLQRSMYRSVDLIKNSFKTMNGSSEDSFGRFLAKTGVKMLRIHGGGLLWKIVEPQKGVFAWDESDAMVEFAHTHNMMLMPILGNMFYLRDDGIDGKRSRSALPQWLLNSDKTVRHPMKRAWDGISPDPEAWEGLVKAVSLRYKGKIAAYEITNEPNIALPSAKEYIPYLESAGKIIRECDPDAVIVGGSVTTDFGAKQSKFTHDLGNSGVLNTCDALSFHPYESPLACSMIPAQTTIDELKKIKDQYALNLALWNTELFYIGPPPDNTNTHAYHLLRRLLIDAGEGVKQSCTINDDMLVQNELAPHWEFGPSWTANGYVPHDLYVGLSVASKLLNGATSIKRYVWPSGVCGYIFRDKNGDEFSAVWGANDNSNFTLNLPDGNYKTYDMFMNPIEIQKTITLSEYPIYLYGNAKDLENISLEVKHPVKLGQAFMTIENGKMRFNLEVINVSAKMDEISVRPGFCTDSRSAELRVGESKIYEYDFQYGSSKIDIKKFQIFIAVGDKAISLPMPEITKKLARQHEEINFDNVSFITNADNDNFYLDIKVKDSGRGSRKDKAPWTGDSIELFFDSKPLENLSDKSYGKTNSRIFIAPKSSNGLSRHISAWNMNISNINISQDEFSWGYAAKISIPWSELNMKYGDVLGFDIKVNDSSPDINHSFSSSVWSGGTENNLYRNHYALWYAFGQ